MVKNWCLFFLISTLCHAAHGMSSAVYEVQNSPLVRHAARVAAKIVYDHSSYTHNEVRRVTQPNSGTALSEDQLELFFHDVAKTTLEAHYSSFCAGGVKGCVYTVDNENLRKKLFIVFPGTQSLVEWSKNFFGITSFSHNIQQSYYDDVENLFSADGEYSFIKTLRRHINSRHNAGGGNADARILDANAYEYYFVGHSRGGGLAFLSAKKFMDYGKDEFTGIREGNVKVITFCSPRLTNAHKAQFEYVEKLGFHNIVHFISPSDIAPQFPFRFVENYGVKIPLKSHWSFRKSHKIPTEEEMEFSIRNFNLAQNIGWGSPVRGLFTLEAKPLLWGVGGACLGYYLANHFPFTRMSAKFFDILVYIIGGGV